MKQKFRITPIKSETGVIIYENHRYETCYNHGFDLYNPNKNIKHVNLFTLLIISNGDNKYNDGDYIYDNRNIRK